MSRRFLDSKYDGRNVVDTTAGGEGHDMVTPLGLASQRGCIGVVRLLLARGARQEVQTAFGSTALHEAVAYNKPAVVELLCSAAGADAALALRDRLGRTPLAIAVASGRAACEAVLRARGATA